MKHKKSLWTTVAVLIVVFLVIMAFTRGSLQFWLYVTAFTAWGIWASVKHLIPFLKECHYRRKLQREQRRMEAEQRNPTANTGSPLCDVLMRHVNYRITGFLQSVYPGATWNWCEKYPETIVANGGKGRIQVFGIDEYNYGEVTLDCNANMTCSLLKIVSLNSDEEKHDTNAEKSIPLVSPQNTVDPQVWFEEQGKDVLSKLINDLSGYGYHRLIIRENGDVTIMQGDKQITKRYFQNVPEKMYWNRLVNVFERAGVAGEVKDDGIVVTW